MVLGEKPQNTLQNSNYSKEIKYNEHREEVYSREEKLARAMSVDPNGGLAAIILRERKKKSLGKK